MTPQAGAELLPCPFCGGTDVHLQADEYEVICNPCSSGWRSEMWNARLAAPAQDREAIALSIADEFIAITETASRVAKRTGNTFVLDRQRVAGMIQAKLSRALNVGGRAATEDGGRAIIEGDSVVIRFPLDAMQDAMDGAWGLHKIDTRYKITDIQEFAKEFVRALNREDEQGTTDIHRMADKAFNNCIENGAFGIEEHEQQDI